MTTTHLPIKPLNISPDIKNDTHKLANLENSLADLTKEFLNRDIDIIEGETNKIFNFAKGIETTLSKLKLYKDQCSKTIAELESEINELEDKIKVYERDHKNLNKQNQFKKQIESNEKKYLAEWEKRIQIASKVDTQALSKVHIEDRKSKANQIFKWIVITIYGQTDNKYYWPNFKEQIFEREDGEDFRVRLGKVNASNARQQQRVKTEDLLKAFSEIAACKQLKKVQKEIEDIRKVAEIYLNCYEMAKTIRNLEKAIEKSRQQSRERDEQAMRWKAREQALKDRNKTNKQYMAVLTKMQSNLAGKIQHYAQKQTTAKEIIERLKQNGSIGPLDIDLGDEKRDNCECSIF